VHGASVDDPYHKMLVESAIDYSFRDRVHYFLGGARINNKFRLAAETCVLGEAGKTVSEEESVNRVAFLKVMLTKKYEEIMRSLNPALFEKAQLCKDMCKRMSGGRPNKSSKDSTFGEKKMWEKWLKIKTEMKKIFTSLPATYHKMKSGTQLYDVYVNIIRDHWFCTETFQTFTILNTFLLIFFPSSNIARRSQRPNQ
jgi:hypothetical protein